MKMVKNKNLKLGILVVALNLAATFSCFWLYGLADEAKENILAAREESEKINIKISNVKRLEAILSGVSGDKKILENAFISEKGLVSFIESVEKAARVQGVELTVSSAYLPRENKEGLSFSLEAEGSFDGARNFVALLQNMPYQIAFKEFSLRENSAKDAPSWKMAAEIEVLSYEF